MNAQTIPSHVPIVPAQDHTPSPTSPMSPSSHLAVNANDRIPDVHVQVTRNPYLVEFK